MTRTSACKCHKVSWSNYTCIFVSPQKHSQALFIIFNEPQIRHCGHTDFCGRQKKWARKREIKGVCEQLYWWVPYKVKVSVKVYRQNRPRSGLFNVTGLWATSMLLVFSTRRTRQNSMYWSYLVHRYVQAKPMCWVRRIWPTHPSITCRPHYSSRRTCFCIPPYGFPVEYFIVVTENDGQIGCNYITH